MYWTTGLAEVCNAAIRTLAAEQRCHPSSAAGLKILIPIEAADIVEALKVFWKPQRRDFSKIFVEPASIRHKHESAVCIPDGAEA
jgi:hypothetical protein